MTRTVVCVVSVLLLVLTSMVLTTRHTPAAPPPEFPLEIKSLALPVIPDLGHGGPNAIMDEANKRIIRDTWEDIVIVDISQPLTPRIVGRISVEGIQGIYMTAFSRFFLHKDYLFLLFTADDFHFDHMLVYDIADPANAQLLAHYIDWQFPELAACGQFFFPATNEQLMIGLGYQYLRFFDISNPAAIQLLGKLDFNALGPLYPDRRPEVDSLALHPSKPFLMIYVSGFHPITVRQDLFLIDYSNLTEPQSVDFVIPQHKLVVNMTSPAQLFVLPEGEKLFVMRENRSSYQQSLVKFDWREPTVPRFECDWFFTEDIGHQILDQVVLDPPRKRFLFYTTNTYVERHITFLLDAERLVMLSEPQQTKETKVYSGSFPPLFYGDLIFCADCQPLDDNTWSNFRLWRVQPASAGSSGGGGLSKGAKAALLSTGATLGLALPTVPLAIRRRRKHRQP